MKTMEEVQQDVAKEYGEENFEVLLDAEISCEDYETAKKLLRTVADKYVDQFK